MKKKLDKQDNSCIMVDLNKQEDYIMSSIKEDLQTNKTLVVEFTKKDGEVRRMRCTLDPSNVGEVYEYKGSTQSKIGEKVQESQSVWDIEKGAWRSFRFDSVLDWYVES